MNAVQFGAYIAAKRKERNMTQKDLAERLNVTPKAVSRWERSVGYPDIEILEDLASALGVSVLNLFDCSDARREINADELMELVQKSVAIDRKNYRIQEKTITAMVLTVTLLTGFLFYVGGYGNVGGSVLFGLLSSGTVASIYYLFSEDDVRNRRIYGGLLTVFTAAVVGILFLVLHAK